MKKLKFIIVAPFLIVLNIQAQFVNIEQGEFKLAGQNFYPKIMNYKMSIRKSGSNYWVTPNNSYGGTNDYECNSRSECLNEILGQFKLIKQSGFNAIRLCGLEPTYNQTYPAIIDGNIYFESISFDQANYSKYYVEITPNTQNLFFSFIEDALSLAESVGLKVILLTGGPDAEAYRESYRIYLSNLANRVKNNQTIMAYDLCNEPEYSSKMNREGLSKMEICAEVNSWINTLNLEDQNHLITIGYASSKTVFGWDPLLLDTDFSSFHPYGSISEVGNEIYWYKTNHAKPWIIGETGFPADGIVVDYSQQAKFANAIIKRCLNCNSKGFSWWQYQDVNWGNDFFENYLGMLNNTGFTTLTDGTIVEGTRKPMYLEMNLFNSNNYVPNLVCDKSYNYFNQNNIVGKSVSGKILGVNGFGLSGAIVKGQLESLVNGDYTYTNDLYTISREDGTFQLPIGMSNINRIEIGYLGYQNQMQYFSLNPSPINQTITNQTFNNTYTGNVTSEGSINLNGVIINGNGTSGAKVVFCSKGGIQISNANIQKGSIVKFGNGVILNNLQLSPINSCGLKSNPSVNLNELQNDDLDISIFPNPFNDLIYLQNNTNLEFNGEIIDATGKIIMSVCLLSNETKQINLNNVNPGIYFLITKDFYSDWKTQKMIKF